MSSEALRRLVLFHFLLKSWKPQKRTFLGRLKQPSTLRLVTAVLGLPLLMRPFPVVDFGHVVAVLANILLVFEEFVAHLLFRVRADVSHFHRTQPGGEDLIA